MNDQSFSSATKSGAAGGLIGMVLANITAIDIPKTVIVAAVGSFVSFFVPYLIKYVIRKLRS